MNNKKQRNRLFTMLLLVMAILMPYGGAWAQTQPSKGDGKVGNPYIITTAEELAWFRDQVNGGNKKICAKIADNVEVIDLKNFCHAADASKKIDEQSWVPIGNSNKLYQGTFDGNGKTITNLYINANQKYMGLFGYTYQSTIKNLTFENANVTNTQSNTGILVGKAGYGSTLQNIKISKTCQIKGGNYTGGIAGELAGNAYNCVNYTTVQGIKSVGGLFGWYSRKGNSITACANYGNVTASSDMVGGLVGYYSSGTIQDCANYGDVKGTYRVAGMAGFVSEGKVQNVFSYGNVSATDNTQEVGMAFGYYSKGVTEGMVAYYSGAKLTVNSQEQTVKAFGSGNLSEDNATGFTKDQLKSGVVAYLLQQNASSEAKWGQNLANDGDSYPVIGSEHTVYSDNSLVNCMTYEIISGSFTNNTTSSAIKYQHGQTINHHVATDATCTEAATKEYWQCQDCLKTYSDSQLTKELTDVTDAEHPALGHDNNEDGYCKRCQHYVAVKPSQESGVYLISKPCHLAWFRDYVNGTIVDDGEAAGTTHSSASAMLTADIDLKNYCHAAEDGKELLSWIPIGYVNNSWKGNMDGQGHTISHLYIKTAQNYVGLFGYIDGATIQDLIFDNAKVENVNTTGTNTSYTGILVGYAYAYPDSPAHIKGIKTTKNCTVIGQEDTGGIVGFAKINLENCENHSSVEGTKSVGGIAGRSAVINIRRSTNYGTVENNKTYIGGIIGYAYGTSIEDCANYGKISSTGLYTGGIAGQTVANSSIQNVFSYGDVTNNKNTNLYSGIIIGNVEGGTLTAKGIVAYNKEALLNNSSENIKIVGKGSLTLEDGKVEADVVKAFTQQQIKSGEVAWLLNGSTSAPAEGSTLAWYQKLGDNADAYPVLKSTGDNTVYQAPLISCDGTTPIGEYANNPNGDQLSHNYQMATVADANGLYGGVCVECNSPEEGVKYIKDFCGILGNNLKLTCADGKYTAKAVTLTDGEAYNSPVDIEVADFKYIRTFDAYKWQSLYVPFRMSLEQLTSNGLNVATPVDIEVVNETITRLNVQKLKSGFSKANYPSLIMCESDGEKTIELADVTLSASKEKFIDCMSMTRNYVFNGVYQANKNLASNSEDAINYIIKDGGLVLRNDDDVPAPQSWYMNVTIRKNPFGGADEPLSSDAKTMPIYVIGEGYATGIENVNAAEEHTLQGIYDLQGRKLSQEPESGIYIKDGKKYVK